MGRTLDELNMIDGTSSQMQILALTLDDILRFQALILERISGVHKSIGDVSEGEDKIAGKS